MYQPMTDELIPCPPSGADPDWPLSISPPLGSGYWFRDGQITQSEPMKHESIPSVSGKDKSSLFYMDAWKRSSFSPK